MALDDALHPELLAEQVDPLGGETDPRGQFADRAKALAEACRLAEVDQPSRVVVDDGAGVLVEEHMFGSDLTEEFDTLQR